MDGTDITRELLNETIKLVHRGTKKDGQGLTAEEYRNYQRSTALLQDRINNLSIKRATGTITPSEDALLDRLIATQDTWKNHKGKPLNVSGQDSEKGGEKKNGDDQGKSGQKRDGEERPNNGGGRNPNAGYGPSTLDVPIMSDLIDEYLSVFGYGPYGSEADRLSTIMGDWASRQYQDWKAGRDKEESADQPKQKAPQRQNQKQEEGDFDFPVDAGYQDDNWDDETIEDDMGQEGPVINDLNANFEELNEDGSVSSGHYAPDDMDPEEGSAWNRKRWAEEDAPVTSGFTKWMDDIQWKKQLAMEGDPEMARWWREDYPKEAALWHRRMMGDEAQIAKDTQSAYSMGKPDVRNLDEMSDEDILKVTDGDGWVRQYGDRLWDGADRVNPVIEMAQRAGRRAASFGHATRNALKTLLKGDPLDSSTYKRIWEDFQEQRRRARMNEEVWVDSYKRNGRTVKGHKRRVWKNAPTK